MEENKSSKKTTIDRDTYADLRNLIRKDFQSKTTTNLEKGKLCEIYAKQLRVPALAIPTIEDAFKAENIAILPIPPKEKKIYASDFKELVARVDELEKDNELLAAKLSDLETAIQNLPN